MNKVALKDVSDLITKGTTPSSVGCEFVQDGINFIKSESITGSKYLNSSIYEHIDEETDKKLKRSRIKEGDLLFSIAGAYLGKIAIVQASDVPANTNQAVGIVRLKKEKVDIDYVYYYFSQSSINGYINKLSSQSSQPNLNLDLLGKLEFGLRSIDEQRKISNVLSALDSKIALNNRINAELEAMAKTVYDYWFVQFDFPFDFAQGKPSAEGKPYKSSGGKMVWREELKREVPKGWEVGTLSNLYDFQYGSGNTNPDNGGQYPVYGSNGIIGGYDKYNSEDSPVIGHIGNNCGSLVFAVGKHFVTYNGVMCKIKDGYDKYFGFITLQNKNLKKHTRGSSQSFISYDILHSLNFILPDSKTMKIFCDLINPTFDKIILNQQENLRLSSLRDCLLPMLMNGQVKVGSGYEGEVESLMAAENEEGYGGK
ncbi:MAG: restriction endonuclease subunit S [Paludibacter sp.]|nr:restriction endonuclease subunit S [Paludibacter sp.]